MKVPQFTLLVLILSSYIAAGELDRTNSGESFYDKTSTGKLISGYENVTSPVFGNASPIPENARHGMNMTITKPLSSDAEHQTTLVITATPPAPSNPSASSSGKGPTMFDGQEPGFPSFILHTLDIAVDVNADLPVLEILFVFHGEAFQDRERLPRRLIFYACFSKLTKAILAGVKPAINDFLRRRHDSTKSKHRIVAQSPSTPDTPAYADGSTPRAKTTTSVNINGQETDVNTQNLVAGSADEDFLDEGPRSSLYPNEATFTKSTLPPALRTTSGLRNPLISRRGRRKRASFPGKSFWEPQANASDTTT